MSVTQQLPFVKNKYTLADKKMSTEFYSISASSNIKKAQMGQFVPLCLYKIASNLGVT